MRKVCSMCVSWDKLPEYVTKDADLGACRCWLDEYLREVINTSRASVFDIEAVLVRGDEGPEWCDCPYFEERQDGVR